MCVLRESEENTATEVIRTLRSIRYGARRCFDLIYVAFCQYGGGTPRILHYLELSVNEETIFLNINTSLS